MHWYFIMVAFNSWELSYPAKLFSMFITGDTHIVYSHIAT